MKFNELLTRNHASLCKTSFCEISYILKRSWSLCGGVASCREIPLTTNYYEVVLN